MSNDAPEKLWLQTHMDDDPDEERDEITWCQDKIGDADVQYTRTDLAFPEELAERLRWVLEEKVTYTTDPEGDDAFKILRDILTYIEKEKSDE